MQILRRLALIVAVSGVAFCLARGASATLVSFRPVTLAELAASANVVAVVERDPHAKGDAVTIVEVLKGTAKPGAHFTIAPAYNALHEQIGKHIAEHGYEGAPSPIEDGYKSSLDERAFAAARRFILFLRCDDQLSRTELAAHNGYESLKKRDAVVAAIAAAAKRP